MHAVYTMSAGQMILPCVPYAKKNHHQTTTTKNHLLLKLVKADKNDFFNIFYFSGHQAVTYLQTLCWSYALKQFRVALTLSLQ